MVVQFGGLLALAAAAFGAPLLARLIPRRLVPPVVLEVLAGIAVAFPLALARQQIAHGADVRTVPRRGASALALEPRPDSPCREPGGGEGGQAAAG